MNAQRWECVMSPMLRVVLWFIGVPVGIVAAVAVVWTVVINFPQLAG